MKFFNASVGDQAVLNLLSDSPPTWFDVRRVSETLYLLHLYKKMPLQVTKTRTTL